MAAVKAMRWGRGPAVVVLNRPPGPSLDPYKRKSHKYNQIMTLLVLSYPVVIAVMAVIAMFIVFSHLSPYCNKGNEEK